MFTETRMSRIVHAIKYIFIPGLKIITTFDWLKPGYKKKHITGCN